jgi:predicted nuclease of predicted toxin-antitoxin system
MKILVDENLLWRIVPKVNSIFPEIIHLTETSIKLGASDYEIWNYAKENSYHILTQDAHLPHHT